jgi:hypothetical protein
MSKERYSAQFTYAGFLDHVFDDEKLERTRLSTCPGGPMEFSGKLNGKEVTIEICSDHTYYVLAKSQKQANDLAKKIEKISIKKADDFLKKPI